MPKRTNGEAPYRSWAERCKDPRWQKRRLEIMERDKFTCRECDDKESTLNVHHRYYERGKDPWDYTDYQLVTLCENCHAEAHKEMDQIAKCAGESIYSRKNVLRMVRAHYGCDPYPVGAFHGMEFLVSFLEKWEDLKLCVSDTERWELFERLRADLGGMTMSFGSALQELEDALNRVQWEKDHPQKGEA